MSDAPHVVSPAGVVHRGHLDATEAGFADRACPDCGPPQWADSPRGRWEWTPLPVTCRRCLRMEERDHVR